MQSHPDFDWEVEKFEDATDWVPSLRPFLPNRSLAGLLSSFRRLSVEMDAFHHDSDDQMDITQTLPAPPPIPPPTPSTASLALPAAPTLPTAPKTSLALPSMSPEPAIIVESKSKGKTRDEDEFRIDEDEQPDVVAERYQPTPPILLKDWDALDQNAKIHLLQSRGLLLNDPPVSFSSFFFFVSLLNYLEVRALCQNAAKQGLVYS